MDFLKVVGEGHQENVTPNFGLWVGPGQLGTPTPSHASTSKRYPKDTTLK